MIIFFKKKENKGEKVDEKIKAHIFVIGRVQGVFFRENTKRKAEKLRVAGWIKNLRDGRIEAIFEGDKGNVEKMVDWARRGSFLAKVDGLDLVWEDYKGEFQEFEIRYDL